jgi:glucosamine-6-phosphate deaminase
VVAHSNRVDDVEQGDLAGHLATERGHEPRASSGRGDPSLTTLRPEETHDMYLITADAPSDLARIAAGLIASVLRTSPTSRIVAATGETPMATYAELASLHRAGYFDTAGLRVFQLDEYLGVGPDDPRSLYGWMRRSLLDPLAISEHDVVRLAADGDAEAACRQYGASVIAAGGFDLAILGLGPNGHLGFNEPPSGPAAPTRTVTLTAESLSSNARYWGSDATIPRRAVTAGMDLLLAARQVVLIVTGVHKRHILRETLHGPIDDTVPASHLRSRPNVFVIADRAAAGG